MKYKTDAGAPASEVCSMRSGFADALLLFVPDLPVLECPGYVLVVTGAPDSEFAGWSWQMGNPLAGDRTPESDRAASELAETLWLPAAEESMASGARSLGHLKLVFSEEDAALACRPHEPSSVLACGCTFYEAALQPDAVRSRLSRRRAYS